MLLRYLPYVGIVTILLSDYPILKYILIGAMCLFVIIAKDPQNWAYLCKLGLDNSKYA
jgi:hypothetical protein